MIREIQITVNQCECDLCHRTWLSFLGKAPIFCPNLKCRTRQWNGKAKPSFVNDIKLPSPRRKGQKNRLTTFEED